MVSNHRIAWACLLASLLQVALSFSIPVAFHTPHRTFIPTSRAAQATKRLSMTEDNSSVGDDGVITKNVLGSTGSYLESLAVSDSLMANDIVMAAMLDTTVTDFISDEGIVTELPMNEKVVDDSLMAPLDTVSAFLAASEETTADVVATSESVSAFLAASQEAAAAAEAKLSKEESEIVPLIPRSNDTVSVAIQVEPSILPASQVVGEPVTAVPVEINTPDVKKILKFAIPAIGVWLCGPLLSLIDTSAVGLLSGTYQQAALNPAAAVTDYSALLIAFMYTATTNMVAAAQEADHGVEGKPRTTKNLIAALQLSGFVGAGLGVFLFTFARPLLRAIIGNDAIHPEVFSAAMKYVRIRALGMPAAVVIGSSQSACLGMQDIKSPLYVLLAAAVVNFLGDMLFVRSTNPIIGGAAGAAWATAFSQYAALFFFMKWLCHRPKNTPIVINVSKAIMELTGDAKSKGASRRRKLRADLKRLAKNVTGDGNAATRKIASIKKRFALDKLKTEIPKGEESFSTRGFLSGKFHARDFLRLPSREDISHFTPYVVPVTTTQFGKVSSYIAMSHVVSSSLGTVSMAAQQVIVSLFYCLCPVADSLSLTAQSFVPAISQKKVSRARAVALRKTGVSFLKAGAVFGALLVGAVGAIPLLSHFFTSDPAVVALVNSVVPWLVGFFSVHGIVAAAEGMLLGQTDLSFLGKAYACFFFAMPYLMLRFKKAALAGVGNVGLTSLWKLFFAYNAFRCALWVGRNAQLRLQTKRQAEAGEQTSAM